MGTLPLISPFGLTSLMLMLPICLAALSPSRLPSALLTAPVAFDDSAPVTLMVPFSGVAKVKTSAAPVAVIGPREAFQPISAFCKICVAGLSALPVKFRGVARSTASRIAEIEIATGASTTEVRDVGGNGGNAAITGALTVPAGESQSMIF